jgi:hypothetical protein
MVGWYVWTAGDALQHAPNDRWEGVGTLLWKAVRVPARSFDGSWSGLWALVWVAFAVVVVAASWRWGGRRVAVVCVAGQSAIAVSMIVLSGQLAAALIAAWLLALAWASADWVMRRSGAEPSDVPLEWTSVALALGLTLLMTLMLALGLTRLLAPTPLWIILGALTIALRRRLLRPLMDWWSRPSPQADAARPPAPRETWPLVALLGLAFLLDLAWALAPEVHYDALSYHLAVPKVYLAERRLLDVPQISGSYLVRLGDMLFTLGLALSGQILAKLLTLAVGVVAALGVYALGRAVFDARVGLWAAALFYATPQVSWLATTAYVDLTVALMLLTSLLALLRWRQSRRTGWVLVAGLLAGAAVGAKMNAFFGLPVMGAMLVWDLWRADRATRPARARAVAVYAAGALLVAAPWYALAYAFTGNPLFPLLNSVFKSPLMPLITWSPSAAHFGVGASPRALLTLPLSVTFDTRRFDETLPRGGLGVALGLLPLAVVLAAVARRAVVGWLLAVAAVYLGLWAAIFQYGRYYVPVLPVVLVLAVAAVVRLTPRVPVMVALLGTAFLAQAALSPSQHWHVPERIPFRLAFGLETPANFLHRTLASYGAAQHVNRVAQPGDKVLGVMVSGVRFYFDTPPVEAFGPRLAKPGSPSTPDALAADLTRRGVTYLVVDRNGPPRLWSYPYVAPAFLDRFATLDYADRGVSVYRLQAPGGPAGATAPANLLRNGGFEALDALGHPLGWHVNGRPRIVSQESAAYHGRSAAVVTVGATFMQPVPVQGGRLYTVGHFARADRADQLARLQINWLDPQGRAVGVSLEPVPAGRRWGWRQMSANAPAQAVTAVIFVSGHEDGEVWIDDAWFGPGARTAYDPAPADPRAAPSAPTRP